MSNQPPELVFQLNVLNLLVMNDELTLREIVDALLKVEEEQGYEQARFAAQHLDYPALCELADVNDPENDPNIMPSRFMLLPGADDKALEANGCLDDIPWPIHPDAPNKLSVEFLKQCLQIIGFLEGELPAWRSESDDAVVDSATDIGVDAKDSEPDDIGDEPPILFDDIVLEAFQKFLKAAPNSKNDVKKESTYVVQAGDTLSAIAEAKGYPYWQTIYAANADAIDNPDLLTEGIQLVLPAQDNVDVSRWLDEEGEKNKYLSANNYRFPAGYFSITLLDDAEQPLAEEYDGVFQAYTLDPDHIFYELKITEADQLSVYMPNKDSVGFYLKGMDLGVVNELNKPFSAAIQEAAGELVGGDTAEHMNVTFEPLNYKPYVEPQD